MSLREPSKRPEHGVAWGDDEEGIDFEQIRERVGFALRGPRRHPKLAATVFLVVAALGLTAAATMPRTYFSQAKLLAQRNVLVPVLTNPTRPVPRDADNPTKNVADMIMRRENLTVLARELDLVDRYYGARSPLLRAKDKVLGSADDDKERLHNVVGTLEKRLLVLAD